ncbi:MAG: hypothetical protein IJM81_04395 [Prevotella sp.]|nr:hypothetical protein [Prevotella sp.]
MLFLSLMLTGVAAAQVIGRNDSVRYDEFGDEIIPVERLQVDDGTSEMRVIYPDDAKQTTVTTDSVAKRTRRDWSTWRPSPKRALWLALVIPGGGQIYNRKYWKLPIVYGGFVGCAYALRWNNQMYKDYSQAYMDLMDDDPKTESYNQFLHLGAQINEQNMSRYQTLFKNRKDRYRRWRDLSVFALIGVYALSVVDAYVDASLSEFDLSDDLSLRVEPAVINTAADRNPIKSNALGIQCALTF